MMKYRQRVVQWMAICLSISAFLLVEFAGAALKASEKEVSATEAHFLITQHQDNIRFVILDIRTPGEFAQGHIAGARHLDFYAPNFKKALSGLDKGKFYLIYCRSGNRSGKALAIAAELGFQNIVHMKHGILEWQAKGYPLVRSAE